jgi:Iron-sulfur cluster-binding domain
VNSATLADLERIRDLPSQSVCALCYAPFSNLYFDNLGDVRVCCYNSRFMVGSVLKNSIDEIWNGPAINEIRESLSRYDVTIPPGAIGRCGEVKWCWSVTLLQTAIRIARVSLTRQITTGGLQHEIAAISAR